jgi:TolA-binding protein
MTLRFCFITLVSIASAVAPVRLATAQSGPETANLAAYEVFLSGDYEAAVAAYQKVLADYPTASIVPAAQLQLAYSQFFTQQYDASLATLATLLSGPPAPPVIRQAALGLEPQAISAQATALPTGDPKRKTLFNQAVEKFTAFIKDFPDAPDVEQVVYNRALANFQNGEFDAAIKDLEANIAKFPNSTTISSSKNLLGLAFATKASIEINKGDTADRDAAMALYKQSTDILREIITARADLTLVNEAYFQLGEILFSQAISSEDEQKAALFGEALLAYRGILPKEEVVAMQRARVESFPTLRRDALKRGDRAGLEALDKENERELRRLADVRGKPDQTLNAMLKMAEIYFNSIRLNEARVLTQHLGPFIEAESDEEKKVSMQKRALYLTAMTYGLQNVAPQAVSSYETFQSQFKGDPIAQNLPLTIGSIFLNSPDPTVNDPRKAIPYFEESLTIYPDGRFAGLSAVNQALAQSRLGQTDESLKTFQEFLSRNPRPVEGVVAQMGIANIYKDTQRWDEAIASYKEVLSKFSAQPQAADAEFWIALATQQKGDNAAALPMFLAFIEKHPKNGLIPTALFTLATAQLGTGAKADGLATLARIADEFPLSNPAPFTYFQRAQILAADGNRDAMLTLMREFIENYPQDNKVYYAYDSLAQAALADAKVDEAMQLYRDYAENYPTSAQAAESLLKIVELQRNSAAALGRYSAMPPEDQEKWKDQLNASMATAQDLVARFPDSPQVALAMRGTLEAQRLLLTAGLKQPADIETYFTEFAQAAPTDAARSKTMFTLAVFIAESDKARSLQTMNDAYNAEMIYAPADLDFYGLALIDNGDLEPAAGVFVKLSSDFANPPGVPAAQIPSQIQEAQAMALFGKGRIAQENNDTAAAGALFETLKTTYPWSPKVLEANFGIAESLREQGKLNEALALLTQIIRATTATADLRAGSMLLGGFIMEDKMNAATDPKEKEEHLSTAIDYFIKIAQFYSGVPEVASQGLSEGAQLLEKQAATITDPAAKNRQLDQAIRAYQDIVNDFPNSEFAPQAQQRLNALRPQ